MGFQVGEDHRQGTGAAEGQLRELDEELEEERRLSKSKIQSMRRLSLKRAMRPLNQGEK